MTIIILVWIYILALLFIYGWLAFEIFTRSTPHRLISPPSNFAPSLGVLLLAGYGMLTAIVQVWSVFLPFTAALHLFLICGGLIFVFLSRHKFAAYCLVMVAALRNIPIYVYLIFFMQVIIGMLMIIKSDHLDNDTGLYHAQVIQWAEKYKAVTGIANLFPNLAFNNSSLLMSALFSFSFVHQYPLHVLNGLLLLALSISATNLIFARRNHSGKFSFLYFSVTAIAFLFLRGKMSLPYPDVSVTVILIAAFYILLMVIEEQRETKFGFDHFTFILAIFTAITIKLTSITALPFAVFLLAFSLKSCTAFHRQIMICTALLFAVPWLYRNYIMSGYLFFPYYQINLFDVAWKLPLNKASMALAWIESHSKTFTISNSFDRPIREWVPLWWSKSDTVDMLLYVWILTSVVVMAVLKVFVRKSFSEYKHVHLLILLWSLCVLALIVWFFTAPAFRFGMVYIILAAMIPLQILLLLNHQLSTISMKVVRILWMGLLVYFLNWPLQLIRKGDISFARHWLLPEPKYKTVATTKIKVNGFEIAVPVGNLRCWNEPLPCTCMPDSNLHLKGNTIGEGFLIK